MGLLVTPVRSSLTGRVCLGMERGLGLMELLMSEVQVRHAVRLQKAAEKQTKLTYRGVAYLKQR